MVCKVKKPRRGGERTDNKEFGTQTVSMTIDELMAHLKALSEKLDKSKGK